MPIAAMFGAHVAVTIALAAVGGLLVTGAAALVYDVELPASVLGVVGAFLLAVLAFREPPSSASCSSRPPSRRGSSAGGSGFGSRRTTTAE